MRRFSLFLAVYKKNFLIVQSGEEFWNAGNAERKGKVGKVDERVDEQFTSFFIFASFFELSAFFLIKRHFVFDLVLNV